MKQRIQIARALACQGPILLMDEPFAAVDAQSRASLQEELSLIWERTRCTIFFITHGHRRGAVAGRSDQRDEGGAGIASQGDHLHRHGAPAQPGRSHLRQLFPSVCTKCWRTKSRAAMRREVRREWSRAVAAHGSGRRPGDTNRPSDRTLRAERRHLVRRLLADYGSSGARPMACRRCSRRPPRRSRHWCR